MQREETGQSGRADDWAAKHQVDRRTSNEGHTAEDRSANAETPVSVLVETQHLASEGHAEGHQDQQNPDDPSQLSREFICSPEKDLGHVDENNGDHEVGTPAVDRAQEPSQRNVVVEELQTLPRIGGRGRVDQCEQDSRNDLQAEENGRAAAEDIPPTRGIDRDRMLGRLDRRFAESEAEFEPIVNFDGALLQAGIPLRGCVRHLLQTSHDAPPSGLAAWPI